MSTVLVSASGSGAPVAQTGQPTQLSGVGATRDGSGGITAAGSGFGSFWFNAGSSELLIETTIKALPAAGASITVMAVEGTGRVYGIQVESYGQAYLTKIIDGNFPWAAAPTYAYGFVVGDKVGLRVSKSGSAVTVTGYRNGSQILQQVDASGLAIVGGGCGFGDQVGKIGDLSVIDSATASTPPAVPGGLTATALSQSAIQVTWQASTGATGYTLTADGQSVSVSSTSYQHTGLSASSQHTYLVKATNPAGSSAASAAVQATTQAAPVVTPDPGTPTTPVAPAFRWEAKAPYDTLGLLYRIGTRQPFVYRARRTGDPSSTPVTPPAAVTWWSADAPINTLIPVSPVLDAQSVAISTALAAGSHVVDLVEFGVPIYQATTSTALWTITVTNGAAWGQPFPARVPLDPAWKPSPGSDGALVVKGVDGKLYEFWQLTWVSGQPRCSYGAISDATGTVVTSSTGSSTAANFSRAAGVIRLDEIAAGEIKHALVFSSDITRPTEFRFPATKTDGKNLRGVAAGSTIPEGARIQLDPSINLAAISGITQYELIIGTALQKYGAYCIDSGGAPAAFIAEMPQGYTGAGTAASPYVPNDAGWAAKGVAKDYPGLSRLPWSSIRVLATWSGAATATPPPTGGGGTSSTTSAAKGTAPYVAGGSLLASYHRAFGKTAFTMPLPSTLPLANPADKFSGGKAIQLQVDAVFPKINIGDYNIPIYMVDSTKPLIYPRTRIIFDAFAGGQQRWPVDKNNQSIQQWLDRGIPMKGTEQPSPGTDASIAFFDIATSEYWELWIYNPSKKTCGFMGHTTDTTKTWGAHDVGSDVATGLHGAAIQLGIDEMLAGEITHAIGVELIQCGGTWQSISWPAKFSDAQGKGPGVPIEGQRVVLDPTFDVTTLKRPNGTPVKYLQTIARGMQKWGAIPTDTSGCVAWRGEPPGEWMKANNTTVDPWGTIFENDNNWWQYLRLFPWTRCITLPADWGKTEWPAWSASGGTTPL